MMCAFCLESPTVKSVPFIVSLGMAVSLNREPASARTSITVAMLNNMIKRTPCAWYVT